MKNFGLECTRNRIALILASISPLLTGLISNEDLQAAEIVPMQYYEPRRSFDSADAFVLPGVQLSLNSGDVELGDSHVLYLVPRRASVVASDLQINATANCPVIANELAIERDLSEMHRDILGDLKDYKAQKDAYSAELKGALKACLEAKKEGLENADELCAYQETLIDFIADLGELVASMQVIVGELSESSSRRFESYGREPGGYVAAVAQLYDPKELEAVERNNPGYEVRVVPIKDVMFQFGAEAGDVNALIPKRTTLGFALAGEVFAGENGSKAVTQLQSGQAVALGISLSRLGACSPNLVRTGTFLYHYQTYGYLKGYAEYNKWQTYERIEKNSSKGGFFTSKAVRSLVEEMKGESGFKFEAYTDDLSIDLADMAEAMRGRMLSRLLEDFATVQSLSSQNSGEGLPNVPANGAQVISDGLAQCPHVYCQAGSWALKGLDAIFGKKVSRSEVKKLWNVVNIEEFALTRGYLATDSSASIIKWKIH